MSSDKPAALSGPVPVLPDNYGAVLRFTLVSMVYSFVMFVVMGFVGLALRMKQAGILDSLDPVFFYQLMTLHGLAMPSLALLAAMGGFAAIIGRTVRLDTRWLWLVFVYSFLGMMIVLVSTVVGGFVAGWTALYPLMFYGGYTFWSVVGVTVGLALVLIPFLIYAVLLIRSVSRARGGVRRALAWPFLARKTGVPDASDPLLSEVLAVAISIPALVCVAAGFVWLVPLWLQASGIIAGVDVLFMKNFDYFFGHLIVNLTIYYAAGLVFFLLPRYTGRDWGLSRPSALALNFVIFLIMIPYFHHLYQDFAQPLPVQVIGQIGTYLSTIPVVVIILLGGLSQYYRAGVRWDVPLVFVAIGLWGWMFGGMAAALDATIAVNQVMHNTLWIPGHFHTYFLLGAVAFLWAFLFFLIHTLEGKQQPRSAKYAVAAYGIGGAVFTLMFLASGASSIPRRMAVHHPEWQIFALVAVPFIVLLGAGILWIGYEMFARLGAAWRHTAEPGTPRMAW